MKEGWLSKKLKDCFRLKSGDSLTARSMNSQGIYPVYGGNGICGYHNEFNLDGNNIIIGRVGALCGNVRYINEQIWLTDNAFKVVDFKYEIDPVFLTYLLNFKDLKSLARQTAQPVISNSSLEGLILEFPESLSEQRCIVSLLDECFASIEQAKANLTKNLNNAKELFQSELNQIFSQKGEGWEEKRLHDIILTSQIGLVRNTKEQNPNFKFRYLKMDSISNDNKLIETKFVFVDATPHEFEKYLLHKGDFLFNTRNSYELVGKSCLYNPSDDVPTLFNNNIMRIKFQKELLSSYVAYSFCSIQIKEYLEKIKSGTTSVVGIYFNTLKDMPIPVPPLTAQKNIVSHLDALSSQTKKLEAIYQQKLNNLEELKKSILQKAFAGELVRTPEKEFV